MKCQKCDKPATFHITEVINAAAVELHLCDEHAYQYLHQNDAQSPSDAGNHSIPQEIVEEDRIEEDADLKDMTDELEESDFECCPCCKLSFLDFRKSGKFGCENDYRAFRDRIEPLLIGIHGAKTHIGKRPARFHSPDSGAQLVRLRCELNDAVATEDYERASVLRDKIKALEEKAKE
ncbi:MAG: UvrB/UvrC motif-containing protein [Thermoguttaceae bacterium]|nr:UvrB/UvrC motif-containing protein [Thermoguttaceae bacterium]MBR6386745.1 UvrB/UvrC motif-containing protein [Thermoguttaceae bacterium]